MKRMVRRVEEHAERHRELLSQQWQQTQWTEKEARQGVIVDYHLGRESAPADSKMVAEPQAA
jgi:hypothetical protein